ncbi:MAG: D-aminoacylase [Patescibacteria group bacterium]|nr:D-aminoacylase [Patescibacteria group bacterium]
MFNLIIKNGTVIDGTGSKKIVADVGVEKNKITAIGKLGKNAKTVKTIDAKGKIVCPGFVDILDHSDNFWTLFAIPRLDSKITQGVTTIIGGNCGSSLTPILGEDSVKSIRKWVDIGNVNINWARTKEFFTELNKKDLGINFGTLIGQETLRRGLVGNKEKITKENIEMMGKMLLDSLEDGAFGMSTGLVFSHAKMVSTEEIKYLAEILEAKNAFYASHIRGESEELLPSINETFHIGREFKISIEISHLKAVGEKYWSDMQKVLEMVNIANEENIEITFDIYPYDTTGSVLYTLLPDWVSQGGRKKMISRLSDSDLRGRIVKGLKIMDYNYENIIISICPKLKETVGKSIANIANNQEISPEKALIEFLISANGHAIVFNRKVLDEENIKLALKNPHCIISSADAAYNTEYVRTGEVVHPRCFGTFPKVLGRYVREQKVLSLENAIEKMTSKPARKIGLKNRGELKKGFFADITVFDPKIVIDKADFDNPYQYSEGIENVIVNGKIVIEDGKHTGELAGKVLKKISG